LKNPGIGRVNKYTEGSGKKLDLITKSNVDQKRQALLKSIGKGKKEDFRDLYTSSDVKKTLKLITKEGKSIFKKTYDNFLDQHKDLVEKFPEHIILLILINLVSKYYNGEREIEYDSDGIEVDEHDILEEKYKNLGNKPKKDDRNTIVDVINTFIPLRESSRKKTIIALGKGKEDEDSDDVKSWKSFFKKPKVSDVIGHLNQKGVQILRKAWLLMKDKYDHKILTAFLIWYTLGTSEYTSLSERDFEDNLYGVSTLLMDAIDTAEKASKETFKKLFSDWEKVLEKKTIIALGKGKIDIEIDTSDSESDEEKTKKKKAGRKKVGHKKKKPSFTEI
jgi:hypothetical protein